MSGSRSIFLTASVPSRSSTSFRTGTRNCARIAGDLKLWGAGTGLHRQFVTSETRSSLEFRLGEVSQIDPEIRPRVYECYWARFAAEIHMSEKSANRTLSPNRLGGDAEPGYQRHCWWVRHYLSAPSQISKEAV